MARKKKDGRAKSFVLKTDIADALDKHAEKTGFSLTAIVEKALEEYLKQSEAKQE